MCLYTRYFYRVLLIMLDPVVLLTGTILLLNGVKGNSLRDVDVDDILQVLQRQISQEQYHTKPRQVEKRFSHDHDNSEDNSQYGSLKNDHIIDLMQKASQDSHNAHTDSRNTKERESIIKYKQLTSHDSHDDITSDQDSDRNIQMLDRILSHFLKQTRVQKLHKVETANNRLAPNDLLHPLKRDDEDRTDSIKSFDDYSKIYVILNPLAIQNSRSKNTLNDLLSKVLSSSSLHTENQYKDRKMAYRYKGFPLKDDVFSRRSRRDSKEMYAPKDTMEDGYKQKRARNERGGGNSGRTAIPYIRHRGDIYERDN